MRLPAAFALAVVLSGSTRLAAQMATATDTVPKAGAKPAERQTISLPAASADASAVKAAAPPTLPTLDSVRVVGVVRRAGATDGGDDTSPVRAGLGDIISVKVEHLADLANRAACRSARGSAVLPCDVQEIALFLDGREIAGIKPEAIEPVGQVGRVQFHLVRSTGSAEAWADLLGNPPLDDSLFIARPTRLSVGLTGAHALPTTIGGKHNEFHLIRVRFGWFIGCSLGAIVFVGLLVWFARRTSLLRDIGVVAQVPGARRPALAPYSLSRFQMAFWFVLVVLSFVYIWLVTGGWDSITGSALGLIGIGAGTGLAARVIDHDDTDPVPLVPASRGFLDDLLRDEHGYAFHRFQMFVWTLVLGVLFLYSVWQRLAMPEFSATLLGLLGISGGTYLGFKIPENNGTAAPAVPPAPPAAPAPASLPPGPAAPLGAPPAPAPPVGAPPPAPPALPHAQP